LQSSERLSTNWKRIAKRKVKELRQQLVEKPEARVAELQQKLTQIKQSNKGREDYVASLEKRLGDVVEAGVKTPLPVSASRPVTEASLVGTMAPG
jgi:light-regulated signal transduction histidine kinase (bacteriophytochrome)